MMLDSGIVVHRLHVGSGAARSSVCTDISPTKYHMCDIIPSRMQQIDELVILDARSKLVLRSTPIEVWRIRGAPWVTSRSESIL